MENKAQFDLGHLLLIIFVLILIFILGWLVLTGKVVSAPDTDGDGLSDEREAELKTNHTNPNTDFDRYTDGEEIKLHKDPLKPNSAKLSILLLDKSWDWSPSIINTISTIFKLSSPNSETVIADTRVMVLIKNEGDDYSNYVHYDLVYEVAGERLRIVPTSMGVIKEKEEKTLVYEEKIFLKDVPSLLINSISNGNVKWDIKVENLNYETFN